MNKGERAIAREERRLEKERKRRIELANKMLITKSNKKISGNFLGFRRFLILIRYKIAVFWSF